MGRGPRGPMRGGGRGRGRPGGRMTIGPRGARMGRGRGRPPPRPGMGLSQTPGRGAGLQAPPPDVATAGAPPSWMSSALKSNGDDDDDDFAQPVPVSKSAAVRQDEGVPPTGSSEPVASSMPPWAKPYKPKTQEPPPDASRVARTPSLGSGMPKWGQKTTPPAPKQPESG